MKYNKNVVREIIQIGKRNDFICTKELFIVHYIQLCETILDHYNITTPRINATLKTKRENESVKKTFREE